MHMIWYDMILLHYIMYVHIMYIILKYININICIYKINVYKYMHINDRRVYNFEIKTSYTVRFLRLRICVIYIKCSLTHI